MIERELAALYSVVRDAYGLSLDAYAEPMKAPLRRKLGNIIHTLEAGLRENHHPQYDEKLVK